MTTVRGSTSRARVVCDDCEKAGKLGNGETGKRGFRDPDNVHYSSFILFRPFFHDVDRVGATGARVSQRIPVHPLGAVVHSVVRQSVSASVSFAMARIENISIYTFRGEPELLDYDTRF